jgi:AraC-like DNA-binding protein
MCYDIEETEDVMQNADIRIIASDYYVVKAKHTKRALHRHEGYEAFFVLQGECEHILISDISEKAQKLKRGNFMVLDNTVAHRFRNGSEDFCVINFLFKNEFILDANPNFESSVNKVSNLFNTLHFDKSGEFLILFEKAFTAFKSGNEISRLLASCYAKEIILKLNFINEEIHTNSGIAQKIAGIAEERFGEQITLGKICKEEHYSLPYVSRKFKETYSISFEKHLQNVRVRHACMLLSRTDMAISEIALAVSYSDVDAFRKVFASRMGITPSAFRKNNGV